MRFHQTYFMKLLTSNPIKLWSNKIQFTLVFLAFHSLWDRGIIIITFILLQYYLVHGHIKSIIIRIESLFLVFPNLTTRIYRTSKWRFTVLYSCNENMKILSLHHFREVNPYFLILQGCIPGTTIGVYINVFVVIMYKV